MISVAETDYAVYGKAWWVCRYVGLSNFTKKIYLPALLPTYLPSYTSERSDRSVIRECSDSGDVGYRSYSSDSNN